MKKVFTILLAGMFLLGSILVVQSKEKIYTIKIGNLVPTEHTEHKACEYLKELVENNSNGKIKVEIYPSNQLGQHTEQIESLMTGNQEMLVGGVAVVAKYFPKLFVMDLPYTMPNVETYIAFTESPFGQEIFSEMVDKIGIRSLSLAPRIPRHLTSNKKVTKIEDVKGLKIRVPEAKNLLAFWRATGANPTPMSFNEVYLSLATNVIDAQENPLDLIYTAKFYEVQKNVALTGHSHSMLFFLVAENFYKTLPDDLKNVLDAAAKETTKFILNMNKENEEKYSKKLKEKGMMINEVDVIGFRDAAKNIYKEFLGPDSFSKEEYQKVVKFVEDYNK